MYYDVHDDESYWRRRESEPEFIESIQSGREQLQRGELITLDEFKKEFGINEPFDVWLWTEVKRLLGNGKNGESPWTRFKRLCLEAIDKGAKRKVAVRLNKDACDIRYERLSKAGLKNLVTKAGVAHDSQPPRDSDEPLILFEHDGKQFLIDGKRRRSQWLKDAKRARFPAIVVRYPESTAD